MSFMIWLLQEKKADRIDKFEQHWHGERPYRPPYEMGEEESWEKKNHIAWEKIKNWKTGTGRGGKKLSDPSKYICYEDYLLAFQVQEILYPLYTGMADIDEKAIKPENRLQINQINTKNSITIEVILLKAS